MHRTDEAKYPPTMNYTALMYEERHTLYRAKRTAAKPPNRATEPAAARLAAPVGTLTVELVDLEADAPALVVVARVVVMVAAPPVAVVDRLLAAVVVGMIVAVVRAVLDSVRVLVAEYDVDAVETVYPVDAVDPVEPETGEILKGNPYWKIFLSLLSVIWIPYVASVPRDLSTDQLYLPTLLSTLAVGISLAKHSRWGLGGVGFCTY
jgi:hypothetical protein